MKAVPTEWHQEINEDKKTNYHYGYELMPCRICHKDVLVAKGLNRALCGREVCRLAEEKGF